MLKRIVLGLAIVGFATIGVAAPAQADPAGCLAGQFCVWDSYGYSGSPMLANAGNNSEYGSTVDNKNQSAYNFGNSCQVYAFGGIVYHPPQWIFPLSYGANQSNAASGYHAFSSHYWEC